MKTMTLKEFYDLGLVQELNRLFLHPMGLALAVKIDEEKGTVEFDSIWDYRDDPEGMVFSEDTINTDGARLKEETIKGMLDGKWDLRFKNFGWQIQPVPKKDG